MLINELVSFIVPVFLCEAEQSKNAQREHTPQAALPLQPVRLHCQADGLSQEAHAVEARRRGHVLACTSPQQPLNQPKKERSKRRRRD